MSENWNQLEVQQLENVKMTTSHQPPEKILAPIYKLSLRPHLDAQSSDNPADEMRNSGRSSRLVTVLSLFKFRLQKTKLSLLVTRFCFEIEELKY